MRFPLNCKVAVLALCHLISGAAIAFTPGNIVVNQSGNGTVITGSSAAPVSIVEFTSSGTAGATVAIPSSATAANQGDLTDAFTSATAGELTLSANGQYVTISGYDAKVGQTTVTGQTSTQAWRNIAQIDSSGNVVMVAKLTDALSAQNARAALTDTGAAGGYYLTGNGDIRYANTTSGVPTTSTSLYTALNCRNGQFAVDSAWNKYMFVCVAGTPTNVYYYPMPFPTTGPVTPTAVTLPSTTSPNDVYFLDVDGNATTGGVGGLDTVYFVDNGIAVKKYIWSGTAWATAGSCTTGGSFNCLAARVVGSNVEVYTTSASGSANKLMKIVDGSGYGGTLTASATTIATAATNYSFRGVAFAPSPQLLASTGTLAALTTSAGVASSSTSFSVSAASGLTGNVTVTAPAGFEVSTTSGSGYASSISLTQSGGALAATTVYVRLAAADSVATYSGNVVCSSAGSAALYVPTASSSVTGAVPTITTTGTPSALSTTYGTASTASSFSVSGANLTANITVTAPAGFQVSTTSGSGYGSSVTLTQSGGAVTSTTIYVNLPATDSATSSPYSGSVSLTSTGATTQTVAIPSSTVSKLALTVSSPAVTTKPYDGTNAATITGTLVGVLSGDTANVTLTGTGTFASTSDGSGIAVTSTSSISGTAAGNYSLTQPTGLTGTITPSASLGGLNLGTGVLSPVLAVGTTSYSATVPSTQTSVSLVPTVDTGATVTVNGVASTGTVSLSPGTNTFTVVVTNGSATPTTQTYTVVITVPTAFTLGNLAVETIGNSAATPMSILELSPSAANQTPVNTYPVPSTGSSALRQSNAGTTGRIGTTNDGTLLAFTGFQDSTGILSGATVTDETAIGLRGVATLDKNYNYTLQATYNVTTTALGDQIRSATSLDNTNWIMDDKFGMYKNNSTTAANATYGNGTNCLAVKSFGGIIYVLSAKTTAALSTLSTDGVTLTSQPGLAADANASDFYLLSSGVHGSTFDVLYILDGATISKFSLVSGSWVQNGSATSLGGATGVGLTAASNGTGAYLYVTTGASLTVLQITDTAGYDAAPAINTSNNVTLYTAPTGQFIKGVALAPTTSALPDLTVAVSGSSSPVVPGTPAFVSHGASATYYLTVANSGAASASGVTTTFTLPTGMSGITATTAGGFSSSVSGSVVTFTGGSVAANSAVNLTVTATTVSDGGYTVDAGPTAVTTGHGTAVVSTSGTESNTANNSANVPLQVIVGNVPYVNVSASGPATAALTTSGSVTNTALAYTLTVQNTGTAAISGASVNFTLPAGTTFVSATDNGSAGFTGSSSGGVVTFTGGTIASGATETLTVNLTSTTSAYRIYSVTLPAGGVTVSGGNAAGNLASVASVSTAVSLPSGPDLTVASTPNGPFLAGDSADTYTVYVSNGGDNVTDGSTVTVSTTFPTGLTPTAASGTGWTTSVSGQTVTATRTDVLSPGAIGTNQGTSTPVYPDYPVDVITSYPALTFTVSVGSSVSSGTQLANTVTVSGGGDAFPANGTSTNTVTIGTPTAISTSGKLLVSRGRYIGTAALVTVGQPLPNGAPASASGAYPGVWGNDATDGGFGVTAPIYLDVLDKYTGSTVASSSLTSSANLTTLIKTQLGLDVSTSFSSKSELGMSLTPDSKGITFMAYLAPTNSIDASNAETPYHYDPTSPLKNRGNFQHVAVQMDYQGNFKVTPIDSYSGDNTRAVVLAPASDGNSYYYIAGSAGNAGSGITGATMAMYAQSTGIQMILPGAGGLTTPVGQPFYNGTALSGTALSTFLSGGASTTGYQLGYAGQPTDKTGKDMNLRSLTFNPFNSTFYAAKGSGGNGVDTIYQIGSGGAPTAANANTQVFTIPNGFPTSSDGHYPFGLWFANATTLYVADEGQANIPAPADYSAGQYTQALPANNPYAGLQKWTFDGTKWNLQYILTNGLNLGVPYTYTIANYPTGTNAATGVPWQPANNGLRNITGQVNGDGTVTIYAVTATISGETDEGADPNQLVAITDNLAATTLPAGESFIVLETADGPDVIRGVALAPASATAPDLWAALTHSGTFAQGDAIGDTVTINVYNSGNASTSGTVTAVATLPTGITPSASNVGTISGWSVAVSGQTVTATRSDALAQGSGYTSLPLAVTVTSGAATSGLTNSVAVSGGGEVYTGNDTASDIITVVVPPVNSLAASGVTSSGANLNGSVNPGGTDTTVYFQYGTSTAYSSQSSPSDIGSGTSPVSFYANLGGLSSGTTYHYRLVTVANGVTTVYADQTFEPGTAVPAMPLWVLLALAGAMVGMAAMSIARKERSAA